MKRNTFLCLCFGILLLTGCFQNEKKIKQTFDNSRIVAFTPSITETLFALGLGNNVVGVSKFCNYPPEVKSITKVGGFIDPDMETVLRLKPTCVVIQKNSTELASSLEKFGVPVMNVPGDTLDEIIASFCLIGNAFGKSEEAQALTDAVNASLTKVQPTTSPRVLMIIFRECGTGTIRDVQIAANDNFYNKLLERIGAQIVPENTSITYPTLSAEAICRLNPDCIVELQPGISQEQAQVAMDDWQKSLPTLDAVKNNRIHILTHDYVTLPGPRLPLLINDLKAIIAHK